MEQGGSVPSLEDIQGLFLEQHLLVREQVVRKGASRIVWNTRNFLRHGMGHEIAARGSLNAMRGENLEFRIILGMVAAMRHHEDTTFAGGVRKFLNVGK